MIKQISDRITYIPMRENPLSSDVIFYEGKGFLWLFDTGCGEEILKETKEFLKNNDKRVKVVISHFHEDHITNIKYLDFDEAFMSKQSYKYIGDGTLVEESIIFDDEDVRIYRIPSSHAKGSLCMCADGYCFVGDAIYSTMKDGKIFFNPQLLQQEIRFLEDIPETKLLVSHYDGLVREKDEVIKELKVFLQNVNLF